MLWFSSVTAALDRHLGTIRLNAVKRFPLVPTAQATSDLAPLITSDRCEEVAFCVWRAPTGSFGPVASTLAGRLHKGRKWFWAISCSDDGRLLPQI